MRHLKYWASIGLSLLTFLIPTVLLVYTVMFVKSKTLALFSAEIPKLWIYIAVGILFLIAFLLRYPLRALRVKYRRSVEYDEYGRSKSKGNYEYLSKEERNLIDLQRTADAERLISTTELKKMTKAGSENPQRDIDKLIGLYPVKEKMHEMVARMEFDRGLKKGKDTSMSQSGRHMVFYGSPGTGKTTVARILTGFLYKYKYIKKNKCIEVDGNFFNAGEQSAYKTELLLRYAKDGVLFIDEAYTLMEFPHGYEVIATIIKNMEDSRDKFILILAGYTGEMQALIEMNPGFSSRIKEHLYFPDFSMSELTSIFTMMASEKGFTVDRYAYQNLEHRIQKEQNARFFGNGRTMRNLLDEAIDRHAVNFYDNKLSQNEKFVLTVQDIVI